MGRTSALLVSEFAMLIFHKAVGAYFENGTITIEAQNRAHGPKIKHGIPQMKHANANGLSEANFIGNHTQRHHCSKKTKLATS